MKVVVDTNVFVSGVFFGGPPGAKYVVSGDRALLATSPYGNVAVIRPRDFMDVVCP